MTRDEIKALIYDDAEVYRPPLEADSALLEVTHGCSYGRCAFCDFANDEHYFFEEDDIEQKIRLLAHIIDGNDRLFFLGSNPFCLPSGKLRRLFDLVHKYLPSVEQISMYARADDVNRKSWSDIMALAHEGLADLHIGLESGSDRVLKLHNKGESSYQIAKALDTLESCGVGYHLTAIPGLGGKDLSEEHAEQTAAFLSRHHPESVWNFTLKIWPNTPLYRMAESGTFRQLTPLEAAKEERRMLSLLELERTCLYVDSTLLNRYTLSVFLPSNKDSALERLDELIAREEARQAEV